MSNKENAPTRGQLESASESASADTIEPVKRITFSAEEINPQAFSEAKRFLRLLWPAPELVSGGSLVVWTVNPRTGEKLTHWLAGHQLEQAADLSIRLANEPNCLNVYYGVCLQDQQAAKEENARQQGRKGQSARSLSHMRGYSSTALAVPALYMDVDYKHDVHKKDNLPDQEAVTELYNRLPDKIKPSVRVHSGSGEHWYWLLDEPYVIVDMGADGIEGESKEARRERIATLIDLLQSYIEDEARKLGEYAVDKTHDLSRVLRLPGTLNRKEADFAKPVTLLEGAAERRYTVVELAKFLADHIAGRQRKKQAQTALIAEAGELTFDFQHAKAPESKLNKLLEDERFKETYQRKRRDRGLKDKSDSGYDYALLNSFLSYGWSRQEAVDGVMESRRVYGSNRAGLTAHNLTYSLLKIEQTLLYQAKEEEAGGDGPYALLAKEIMRRNHFAKDRSGHLYVYRNGVYQPDGDERIGLLIQHLCSEWGIPWLPTFPTSVPSYIRPNVPYLWERPPETL